MRTKIPAAFLGCLYVTLSLMFGACVSSPDEAPPDPQQVWAALHREAVEAYERGRYDEGIDWARVAYRVATDNFGATHYNTLACRHLLGVLYHAKGEYDKAQLLLIRALMGREEFLGPTHPDTLSTFNSLAILYLDQGLYDEAEELLTPALEEYREQLGPTHPHTLATVNNLALVHRAQGRYREAETLHLEILPVRVQTLDRRHRDTLTTLNNLAGVYMVQGRYEKAEPFYLEVKQGREETLGLRHPDTLASLHNLASVYRAQGRYEEAEPLLTQALPLHQQELGPKHPQTLAILHSLALLYIDRGRYEEAEPLLTQALTFRREVLEPKHPDTLNSLTNLAMLYQAQGRYDDAEPMYMEASQRSEELLGPTHPHTLSIRVNLAYLFIATQREEQALHALMQLERHIQSYIWVGLPSQRVRRQSVRSLSEYADLVLSLAQRHHSKDVMAFAAGVFLRWKKILEEEDSVMESLARTAEDPEIRDLGQRIRNLRSAVTRALHSLSGPTDLATLTKTLEAAERELTMESQTYKTHLEVRRADIRQVRRQLSPHEALIEFKVYRPFDAHATTDDHLRMLGLLVLPNGQDLLLEDLGPVAEIRSMWQDMCVGPLNVDTDSHCVTMTTDMKDHHAALLYRRLLAPFDPYIKELNTVVIAPDGFLHLVPFERLVLPDGRYWVERQLLRQVQSGRDLLRNVPDATHGGLLVVGGVDFDRFEETAAGIHRHNDEFSGPRSRAARELEHFPALPATRDEVDTISREYEEAGLGSATILSGTGATEGQLKHLPTPPQALHLAIHGFYLSDKAIVEVEHPLALSGLTLAGANQGLEGNIGPDGEDGILYSLEILGLNLEGTELVVLSACDTGKGVIDYSEGVYGLVRAFRIAGAQSVLMTLWAVDDEEAKDFMIGFYQHWMAQPGGDFAAALRDTKLNYIRRHKDSISRALGDPSEVWAPYVLTGGATR